MIHFGFGYLVVKQQLLCVRKVGRHVPFWPEAEYDGAGAMMSSMIHFTLVGLLSSVVLNSAYLFVRKSYAAGAVALAVLPYLIYIWCGVAELG